jgi:nitrate reductase molybdenum cofactor assembly chaperone
MHAQNSKRYFCAQLAPSLEYPHANSWQNILTTIDSIEPVSPEAARFLKEFCSRMKRMELPMWQEFYVQTFDLMPKSSLYLSIYLFGEESFKRAELMAGLKEIYEKHQPFEMIELPDHLAVILRQNASFTEEEWSDLVSLCMKPALPRIISKLESSNNPYAFILKAVQELLAEVEKTYV